MLDLFFSRNTFNFFLSLFIIYAFLCLVPGVYGFLAKLSVTYVGIKLAEWLMTITRKYVLYKKVDSKNKAILITGCDSGFGNALAKRMDSLGYKVFAACLFPEGSGAKYLMNNCSRNLQVLPLDVTSSQSIQDAKDFISKNLQNDVLWAVVNNAGTVHAGEIDWTPFEELQRVYNVNTEGTLRVTKAFLPLVKKSKGRIVNNTSITGRFACPGFAGYCMSKSATIALTTSLRIETKKWGVKAISVEPSFYSTPLTQEKSIWKLVDNAWQKAPEETKEEYGEVYIKSFKENVVNLLTRCSPHTEEVIESLEDAITSVDPLTTYFTCNLAEKIQLKFLLAMQNRLTENHLRMFFLDRGAKPAALQNKKSE